MSEPSAVRPGETDRNLLFGVLALQTDLIDAGQFAEICAAWAARKHVALAELLVERRWITPADRADVERLLQRKLRKHGGDARASLGEVAGAAVRQSLTSLEDAAIQASLRSLPSVPAGALATADDKAWNWMAADTAPPGPASSPSEDALGDPRQRYTLTRLHAKGGLGQVWLARDRNLGRDVALKEMQAATAQNRQAWVRFVEEARITGQLEHPGIVPVYELARRSDNAPPFYTMRFIRGRTLSKAIRAYFEKQAQGQAGPLERNALLNVFVAVCNAVAYAHARGVVHRDLKGDNVVLGDFGEVSVLDWGLAKVVGRAEDAGEVPGLFLHSQAPRGETLQGEVMGTPPYMAPEQADGRVDQIDQRTDVYSLGAILYEILTGRPPFTGEVKDVLRRVREEEPARPRQVRPGVPPALEAVCMRALAKKPVDRYASAGELAAEVQRWLADEPVAAYREPWAARLGRWARRHRPWVAAAVALLVTSLVGLALGLWAVRAEQRRTAAERDLARANLDLAKKAVDDCFLLATEHPLLQGENMRRVRRLLLEKALPSYEGFQEQRQDDPAIQAGLAHNYSRLASIRGEIERKADALEAYRQALALYEKLAMAHPNVSQYQYDLAVTHNALGILQDALGQSAEALQSHQRAQALLERLAAAYPDDPQYQYDLAMNQSGLGNLQRNTGQPAAALKSYALARALCEQLVAAHPDVPKYQSGVAITSNNLANVQADTGDRAAALESYEKARALQERLVAGHPGVTTYQTDLAVTYNNLATVQKALGQSVRALESFARALALRQKLADTYPEVTEYQSALSATYNNLGILQRATGQTADALKSYERARDLREKLATAHPEVAEYQRDLAGTCNNLGNLHSDLGQAADALKAFEQARALQERLVAARPEASPYQSELATTYNGLANLHRHTDKAAARKYYEQARALQEKLVAAHPQAPDYQSELATTCNNLGVLQAATDPAAALRLYERARALQEQLVAAHPEAFAYQNQLARTYNNLGLLQSATDQPEAALKSFEQARALGEKLTAASPAVPEYQMELVRTYFSLGIYGAGTGQPEEALVSYGKAISVLQALRQREPNDPLAWQFLGGAHQGRAEALTQLGRHAQALEEWDRALAFKTGSARDELRLHRAFTLARLGEHARAAREADDLSQGKEQTGTTLYNLACVYALSSAAAEPDKAALQYAARAVALLAKAHAVGFFDDPANVAHVKKDSDLDPLRSRDDFQKLVRELDKKNERPAGPER
jgi:serine/threonine-protein kinase